MVLLAVLAASGGAVIAGVASWKECTKPFVRRKVLEAVRTQGPAHLGGSKCEVEDVDFSVGSKAYLRICGLEIRNLPPYTPEDNIVAIERITLVVDLHGSLSTGFKKVGIDSLSLEGCRVSWEKGLTSSNLDELLQKLSPPDPSVAQESAVVSSSGAATDTDSKPALPSASSEAAPSRFGALRSCFGGSDSSDGPEVLLHEVSISEITVVSSLHIEEGMATFGAPMPVPDIKIADFSQQFGSPSVEKIVKMIVVDIVLGARKVVSSVGGTVMEAVGSGLEDFSTWLSSWFTSSPPPPS